MTIVAYTNARKKDWNDFVQNDPDGTFFHLAEWKEILERAFGFQTFYMMEEVAGGIKGVLPLALVKRPVFGPVLISNPLGVYGGGMGDCQALEQAAIKKADELDVEYLELRGNSGNDQALPISDRFYTFRRTLSADHEENLKSIPRKQRAEVRKGLKENLEMRFDQDIDTFYKIYSSSVRGLGTPVFSKKYLRVLVDVFGSAVEIATVSYKGKNLTSVLSFKYKNQILPYYGGGLPAARQHSAYPFMYWKVMERAVEEGLSVFDFGRSMKGSGAYSFKKNFGFDPEPLQYRYHLVKSDNLPDMDPDNPKNKFLISTWKKLPLPVANVIGPYLYPAIV